jgi:hypothetical protein
MSSSFSREEETTCPTFDLNRQLIDYSLKGWLRPTTYERATVAGKLLVDWLRNMVSSIRIGNKFEPTIGQVDTRYLLRVITRLRATIAYLGLGTTRCSCIVHQNTAPSMHTTDFFSRR